jgi:hypothetical protein
MLSLEARDLESAREKYLEYVGNARLDRSEPIEHDEQAQVELEFTPLLNWRSTLNAAASMAPGEWNGNNNDRAFLMVGVSA